MITFTINKHIKVRKYLVRGIRLDFKYKNKWISIKINENELELLIFIMKAINDYE